MNKYRWNSESGIVMNREFEWPDIANKRKELHLALLYMIVHGMVVVLGDDILINAHSRTPSHRSYKYIHIRTSTDNHQCSLIVHKNNTTPHSELLRQLYNLQLCNNFP